MSRQVPFHWAVALAIPLAGAACRSEPPGTGERALAEAASCRPGLQLTTPSVQSAIMYRSHAIGIYPGPGR